MIKCSVTICGTINRSAQMRTNSEGKQILCIGVNVVVPAKSGINKTVEVSVSKVGQAEEIINYPVGSRVEVTGTMSFRKKGEALYFNMTTSDINTSPSATEDSIKGEMEFKGALGKKIETKTDKKGNPFCVFSAFSSEKIGENFEFLWVRFMHFGESQKEWMQPKANIQAKGELQISVFNDRLDIACKISELSPWEKKPFNSNN